MITYTVMADCGVGEFLWSKKESDVCGVGGNVYSLMDVNCIHEDDDDLIMSMCLDPCDHSQECTDKASLVGRLFLFPRLRHFAAAFKRLIIHRLML